jgi:hypothetical protein
MRVRVVTITKSSPRKAPPKKDTYLFTKLRHTGSVKGEVFSLRLVGRMWGVWVRIAEPYCLRFHLHTEV